ncbi:MAG: site-2 protease family protein [Actinomycetota bacterium]|nr:site-2 protease family protein [Actinomycetota bacterium]
MSKLETLLYLLPIFLASLTLHELAHAVVATRFGDPTPREQGRLTLNPLAHLDPLGTLTFVVTYFLSSFLFGWAKPVQVHPGRFRHPKQQMAVVAAAGPATNFLLALVCVAALVHVDLGPDAVEVLIPAYQVNLVLGIFNLIPLPPLDGSRIVGAFMSDYTYLRWSALDQYGMVAIFALIVLFQRQFFLLFDSAFDSSTRVMVEIVGG